MPGILANLWNYASRLTGVFAAGPYRGADVTRLNKAWQPQHYSGDGAIRESWDLMTRRIRDLGRNDPAIIALRRTLVDQVIKGGLGTSAGVLIGDDLIDDFNEEADREWEQWCLHECDAMGRLAWGDIQRQLFAEMLEPGMAFLLRCSDPDPKRQTPLCYLVLESEQLDRSKDQPAGRNQNEIVQGIEVAGPFRRPVAYWLFDVQPSDPHAGYSSWESRRIPADRVIPLTLPGRPSALHGISLYSSIVQPARDIDTYIGSELTSAIIGSLLSIVHKTDKPGSGFGFVGDGSDDGNQDGNGNPKIKLGRGIVTQIGIKDDLEVIDPKRPNNAAKTFTDLIMLLLAMGGGVSKYRLTRDYSATTYVAARAARLDDADAFRPMQAYFWREICLPVRKEWTAQMAAYGRFETLTATQFRRQERRWTMVEPLYPGTDQIDPEKETDSDIAAIGAGTDTLESVCARKGKNWRKVLQQRAREQAYAKRLGLELNYDRPSTPAKPRASDEGEAAGRAAEGDDQVPDDEEE